MIHLDKSDVEFLASLIWTMIFGILPMLEVQIIEWKGKRHKRKTPKRSKTKKRHKRKAKKNRKGRKRRK